MNEVFDHLEVRNNHVIARTTATPRTDGLFGFNPACDFKTITIRDNVIECQGQAAAAPAEQGELRRGHHQQRAHQRLRRRPLRQPPG